MIFSTKTENRIKHIEVNKILPNRAQPRMEFNEEEIEELAQSIQENGLLQPITVRRLSQNKYELISGERRLRAFNLLEIETVPAIILNCDDKQSSVFALIENLQRCNLNAFEESEAILKLMKKQNLTQEEIAKKIGKKQSTVANKLRILKLTKEERDKIIKNNLTERHARALLKIMDCEERMATLDHIIANNFNVKQSEIYINAVVRKENRLREENHRRVIIKDVRIFINTVDKAIKTMKSSGIDAFTKQNETEEYLEYTVRIPKESAIKPTPVKWTGIDGHSIQDNDLARAKFRQLRLEDCHN